MDRSECVEEVNGWDEGECQECGKPFPKRNHYERRCPICYKLHKSYKLLWGDQAFLWAQEQVNELRLQLRAAQQEVKTVNKTERAGPINGLRGDLLRQVISLCHPDRHAGSEKATEVTKKLLAMRQPKKKKRRTR